MNKEIRIEQNRILEGLEKCKEFSCDACNYFSFPIYKCNGNCQMKKYCSSCSHSSNNSQELICPKCTSKLEILLPSNLLEIVVIKCKNSNLGCKETSSITNLLNHENQCMIGNANLKKSQEEINKEINQCSVKINETLISRMGKMIENKTQVNENESESKKSFLDLKSQKQEEIELHSKESTKSNEEYLRNSKLKQNNVENIQNPIQIFNETHILSDSLNSESNEKKDGKVDLANISNFKVILQDCIRVLNQSFLNTTEKAFTKLHSKITKEYRDYYNAELIRERDQLKKESDLVTNSLLLESNSEFLKGEEESEFSDKFNYESMTNRTGEKSFFNIFVNLLRSFRKDILSVVDNKIDIKIRRNMEEIEPKLINKINETKLLFFQNNNVFQGDRIAAPIVFKTEQKEDSKIITNKIEDQSIIDEDSIVKINKKIDELRFVFTELNTQFNERESKHKAQEELVMSINSKMKISREIENNLKSQLERVMEKLKDYSEFNRNFCSECKFLVEQNNIEACSFCQKLTCYKCLSNCFMCNLKICSMCKINCTSCYNCSCKKCQNIETNLNLKPILNCFSCNKMKCEKCSTVCLKCNKIQCFLCMKECIYKINKQKILHLKEILNNASYWNFSKIEISQGIFALMIPCLKLNNAINYLNISNCLINENNFQLIIKIISGKKSFRKFYACNLDPKTTELIRIISPFINENLLNHLTKFYFSGSDCGEGIIVEELERNSSFKAKVILNSDCSQLPPFSTHTVLGFSRKRTLYSIMCLRNLNKK